MTRWGGSIIVGVSYGGESYYVKNQFHVFNKKWRFVFLVTS
jgi:hypothetical protein